MAKGTKGKSMGAWAFLIGVILAIIMGLFGTTNNIILAILVVVGILVGLMNVSSKETQAFLLAGAVLVIVSALGQTALSASQAIAVGTFNIGTMLSGILNALLILFVPATVIVALKSVFQIAKD